MSTLSTVITVGAAVVIGLGVGLYFVKKHNSQKMDFVSFKDECISSANKYSSEEVKTAVIVIDKVDNKVIPSLYRRYEDGRVTKTKLPVAPFSYDALPQEIKANFNNGQSVIAKI